MVIISAAGLLSKAKPDLVNTVPGVINLQYELLAVPRPQLWVGSWGSCCDILKGT